MGYYDADLKEQDTPGPPPAALADIPSFFTNNPIMDIIRGTLLEDSKMAEHELKFTISNPSITKLTQWLDKRCIEDPKFPVGIVSSVYYDTPDWQYLHEKINSDFLKTKLRFRWYQSVTSHHYYDTAFFERKDKIGSTRKKKRINIGLHDAVKNAPYLNDRFFYDLPRIASSKDIFFPTNVLPTFQISYTRRRFLDPLSGARLSVDYDINVPRVNPMVVKGRSNPLILKTAVFEYKSDKTGIPDFLQPITSFGCRKSSFSKYSTCYQHITGCAF